MATESPIMILEGTEKWQPLEQSTSFGSSSSNITIEDLGLLINDQRFQSPEKDVMPSRCESAPPSTEGSKKAVENLFSQQKSIFSHSLVYTRCTVDRETDLLLHSEPSSSSYHDPDVVFNQRFADPLNSGERYHPFQPISSRNSDRKMTPHAKCVGGSGQLPRNILPVREEESEDDGSSEQSVCLSFEKAALLGFHLGSVDSTQENPHLATSSIYDRCHSSHKSAGQTLISDTESSPLDNLSISISTAGTNDPSSDDMRQTSPLDAAWGIAVNVDGPDNISTSAAHIEAVKIVDATTDSNSDFDKVHNKDELIPQNNMQQQQIGPQESNPYRVQGFFSQVIYPGIGNSYGSLNQFHCGTSSVSTAEVHPTLQSSGFTPPLFAMATGFVTSPSPFYPNLQPSGFFAPQYNMGGYTFNSAVYPSYLHGFPYQGSVPWPFDSASFPTSGAPNGGNLHAYDMQNLKFYGQAGVALQHSFSDLSHPQFLQLPMQDTYGAYCHFGHQTPRDGAALNQVDSRDLKKETDLVGLSNEKKDTDLVGLSNDHKSQHSARAGYNSFNIQGGTMPSHYSFGRPTNVGHLLQFPTASTFTPVAPTKPVGWTNSSGGRYNMSHSHSSGNRSKTYGLQSQSWNDMNPYSFLEELKSDKGQRFELSDIAGHICEFSTDQHGSRFIQQKLETCSVEEKASVFKEVVPNSFKLMTDVFGNYVIQKLFEYGSPEQRKDLANKLEGHILSLSLQMYGCRVIQKAVEVIDLEQKARLAKELEGHVIRCVRDQNGNHVIQKCIESIPIDKIHFIISSFRDQVATLSMHPYGCRVIQRVLERCKDELQTQFIVNEILDSVCSLAQDQYGNYVVQHVLERGEPHERSEIVQKLSGSILQFSQHKFASNVVEKCLECGDSTSRGILIKEIIGHGDRNDNLLIMMKDQYANYVIQKILQICTGDQQEELPGLIRNHLTALKKFTYGKHIIARFEQIYGEEIQTSES